MAAASPLSSFERWVAAGDVVLNNTVGVAAARATLGVDRPALVRVEAVVAVDASCGVCVPDGVIADIMD